MDINGDRVPSRLDQNRMVPSPLTVSKDHLEPNPFTWESLSRKRTFPEPRGINHLRLAHRCCNSMRGQREINPALKLEIKASLVRRYSATMDQFAQFDLDFRSWRESFDTNAINTKRTPNNEAL